MPKSSVNERNYWGIELSYGNQFYSRRDSIEGEKSILNYQITYENHRQFLGLFFNFGWQTIYLKRFEVGFNLGIGARYNAISNGISESESKRKMIGDWTNPAHWIQQKGNHFIPKFNFEFRIGYRLK